MNCQSQMQKIRIVSGAVRVVCRVLFVFTGLTLPVAVTLICLGFKGGSISLPNETISVDQLSASRKGLLIVIIVLGLLVVLKALGHLHRLFGNYAEGKIFTQESVAQIRQLGIAALCWGGVQFLSSLAQIFLLTDKGMVFSISLEPFVIGVLAFVISWVMDVGRNLNDENELTI